MFVIVNVVASFIKKGMRKFFIIPSSLLLA